MGSSSRPRIATCPWRSGSSASTCPASAPGCAASPPTNSATPTASSITWPTATSWCRFPRFRPNRPEWESPEAAVADILKSEQRVTEAIEELYDLSEKVHDRAASIMLQWFINEQVEEENVARTLLGRLRLVGGDGVGMLMIDQELAKGTVPGAMAEPGADGAE